MLAIQLRKGVPTVIERTPRGFVEVTEERWNHILEGGLGDDYDGQPIIPIQSATFGEIAEMMPMLAAGQVAQEMEEGHGPEAEDTTSS